MSSIKRIKFNNLKIGQTFSFEHSLSTDNVQSFVELSGDTSPMHIDKEFGEKTIFKKNIVHGMLLASFFSKIIGLYFSKNIIYLGQTLEFRKPAFINDVLLVEAIVKSKSISTKIVTLNTAIKRNDDVLLNGQAKFKYL
tara:strand:- start:1069 stop:1485 length:417 start_codon:yes stop_codon:yes gene_type:complete